MAGIIFLLINIILLLKNFKVGLFTYLLFSLIAPVIRIGGIYLSYDIVAFIPLFLLFLYKNRKIYINKIIIVLLIYNVILLISSVISLVEGFGDINFIGLFAVLRFTLLLSLLLDWRFCDKQSIKKVLFYTICINFVFSCVQLLYPPSTALFYSLYWKPSAVPLELAYKSGYFLRAIGTFYSPTILGALSLITFAVFYFEKRYNKGGIEDTAGIFLSVFCSLLALSKTGIVGIPLIIAADMILRIGRLKKIRLAVRVNFSYIFVLICVSVIIYALVNVMEANRIPILYYLDFILNPQAALSTRYEGETGILSDMNSVIADNMFLGVGEVISKENIFIGDSSYYTIMYSSGITGLLLNAFIWGSLFFRNLKKGVSGNSGLFVLCAMLMTFIGTNIVFTVLGAITLQYAYSEE